MAPTPESDPTEDHSSGASDPDRREASPNQDLAAPLPSSEMFLAAFAEVRPIIAGDILDPAFDLVACQREKRLAEQILTDETAGLEELRVAGRSLVSARTDIAMLMTIIDEAVRQRIYQQHRMFSTSDLSLMTNARPPGVEIHTESIGDIAVRMAELWELLDAADDVDPPEAVLLMELCTGYDQLAADIEAGCRIPAGL